MRPGAVVPLSGGRRDAECSGAGLVRRHSANAVPKRHGENRRLLTYGLKALEQVKTPLIDGATLEKLLRVYRRVAIRLMRRFGGYQAGPDVPDRPRLARAAAREDRRRRSVFLRTKRRERLGNQLAEVSRDLAQRSIVIPAAPNVADRELSGLPSTIRMGPGKLELACIDAQDLLRQLMELAQASGGRQVEYSQTRHHGSLDNWSSRRAPIHLTGRRYGLYAGNSGAGG